MVTVIMSDEEYALNKSVKYIESLKAKYCKNCETVFTFEGLEERRAERGISANCPNCKGVGELVAYNKSGSELL